MGHGEVIPQDRDANGEWSLCVLVAEDDPRAARALAFFLEQQGHVVLMAFDGPSALAQARTAQPDAILLDIGLPGMDGWQVVEQLREQIAPKRPLVIAITGHGDN